MANIPATPLSNIQLELLKLYATGVSDDTLLELKELMSQFLMQKLREEAGKVWIEKGYTESDLSNWLNNGLE
jgi:hypothetical protein